MRQGARWLALAAVAALAIGARVAGAEEGDPRPYGRVILDQSHGMKVPAVAFDHVSHRAWFTCRVCHVDLGFALQRGGTQISADANREGQYCGACHDGKRLHEGRPIFAACSGWPVPDAARGCLRCHAGPEPRPSAAAQRLASTLPPDVAGDPDWDEAERRGVVKPRDVVEGLSLRRSPMKLDRDLALRPIGTWMSKVTFSHKKHGVWLGCELCHPEIFPVTRQGTVRIRMADIRAGRYCGACHLSVAFPVSTCDRCHEREKRVMER